MFTIKRNIVLIIFLSIYFFLGITIYTDYGIGIEEHFQRKNGFYWLSHLLDYLNLDSLKNISNLKYDRIISSYPTLPDTSVFNFYGVIFDVPAAFFEILLNLNSTKSFFQMRHLLNFVIYFISSIFFFKILINRFNYNIGLFGISIYLFTPRIFGDSFHNNKDILFLSLLTISISFLFNYFEKSNNKNLVLFCLFGALATSTRIMGIYLPILFIFFIFIEYLVNKKNFIKFLNLTGKVLFFFILFLYLHYPYMWQLNIIEISDWFSKYFYSMNLKILFNGQYYYMNYLPRSYLPVWIGISTPFILIILFGIGSFLLIQNLFVRIINIDLKRPIDYDFWNNINEKKDLYILISFFSFFIYAIFLNVAMLSGWRHFYFLHIFFTYISIYGVNSLIKYLNTKINLNLLNIILSVIVLFLIYENYKFHPYQSLYFNNLIDKKLIKKFQIDTPSLSRSDALKFILKDGKNKNQIFVGNASWTPFINGKDLLDSESQKRLVFVGQDFNKADYIYDNFIYKSDKKFIKGYMIPEEFKIIKKLVINKIHIYSLYKKVN
tara:strand:+ start:226 stop:1875 length:1650 start_codon:yes stop_codon:yes gene_type:complete